MHTLAGSSLLDNLDAKRSSFIHDLALIGRTVSRNELVLKSFALCLPMLLKRVQHLARFQRALARVLVCQEGAEGWVRPPQREPLRVRLRVHADVLEDNGLGQTPSAKHKHGLLGNADVVGSVATLVTDHRSEHAGCYAAETPQNATVRDQPCNDAA